ncbi:MAG: zf-HC2 domain-containing protein [Candidatus Palauibacterales bacterium]|nr:zf-HC2 domain-containing protein [Candidatus Palauibacterales bacterium]MDP2528713.1 zf-HC2 domain-containing protein [Candidatus Palauibacterales bacterium]MDP2585241.1 zf-HC2 domain-containing protein [Candidatus Palauibacterales bacterium]
MSQGEPGSAGASLELARRWIGCREVLESLYDYLDGELGPARELRVARHLEACAACGARVRFERSFLQAIRRGRAPSAAATGR